MGNCNSGRRGGRPTKEGTGALVLDVNRLMRLMEGHLAAWMTWTWQLQGRPVPIALVVNLRDGDAGTLRIVHGNIVHLSGETGAQDYTVALVAKPCRFGGRRWYFLCPRTGRRCTKLYLPNGGRRFWSRQAYRLAYRSQRRGRMDAAHARLDRLFHKLGGDYRSLYTPAPRRPKGMHARTYARHVAAIEAARAQVDAAFLVGAARILRRAPAGMRKELRDLLED